MGGAAIGVGAEVGLGTRAGVWIGIWSVLYPGVVIVDYLSKVYGLDYQHEIA